MQPFSSARPDGTAPPAPADGLSEAAAVGVPDRRRLMGRLAAGLLVGSGAVTAVTLPLPSSPGQDNAAILAIAVAALALGVGAWFAPWGRWPRRATLALVPPAFALIALGNAYGGIFPFTYGIFFVVAFVWLGLAQDRWTSVWVSPLAVAAYLLPILRLPGDHAAAAASTAVTIPVCVMIGEALAFVVDRMQHARMAALRLGELYEERHRIALALQESLLPPELPAVPGLEIAAWYRPAGDEADVGGDFYDSFTLADGTMVLAIGDVCGKGVEAAALTGLARHTLRAAAQYERRPSRLISALNRAMLEQAADFRFCTVLLMGLRLEVDRVVLTLANGGHPLPVIVRADGRTEEAGAPGTLVGIFPESEFADVEAELRAGDAIVAHTDGLIDERRVAPVSPEEQVAAVASSLRSLDAEGMARGIERALLPPPGQNAPDDAALLVVRVPSAPAPDAAAGRMEAMAAPAPPAGSEPA
jgi:phosphoserine phosphatase RsbU/P